MYLVFATVAFRLFGLHTWALTLSMLILIALSAAAFLLHFSGATFASVVTLYFCSLTVMAVHTNDMDHLLQFRYRSQAFAISCWSAYYRSFTSVSRCSIRCDRKHSE